MKRDRDAGARRARVVQALTMQAGIATILLLLMFLDRGSRQSMALYGVTLLIPIGWGYVFWNAYQRDTTARAERRWDAAFAQKEKKRSMGALGALFLAWFILAATVVVLL